MQDPILAPERSIRIEGMIKSIESCADIRGWNCRDNIRAQYLRDDIKHTEVTKPIPTSVLLDILIRMNPAPPEDVLKRQMRCNPLCKSKAFLDLLYIALNSIEECLKGKDCMRKYFDMEEFKSQSWPNYAGLTMLQTIRVMWTAVTEEIIRVSLDAEPSCSKAWKSCKCVSQISREWCDDMIQQSNYVASQPELDSFPANLHKNSHIHPNKPTKSVPGNDEFDDEISVKRIDDYNTRIKVLTNKQRSQLNMINNLVKVNNCLKYSLNEMTRQKESKQKSIEMVDRYCQTKLYACRCKTIKVSKSVKSKENKDIRCTQRKDISIECLKECKERYDKIKADFEIQLSELTWLRRVYSELKQNFEDANMKTCCITNELMDCQMRMKNMSLKPMVSNQTCQTTCVLPKTSNKSTMPIIEQKDKCCASIEQGITIDESENHVKKNKCLTQKRSQIDLEILEKQNKHTIHKFANELIDCEIRLKNMSQKLLVSELSELSDQSCQTAYLVTKTSNKSSLASIKQTDKCCESMERYITLDESKIIENKIKSISEKYSEIEFSLVELEKHNQNANNKLHECQINLDELKITLQQKTFERNIITELKNYTPVPPQNLPNQHGNITEMLKKPRRKVDKLKIHDDTLQIGKTYEGHTNNENFEDIQISWNNLDAFHLQSLQEVESEINIILKNSQHKNFRTVSSLQIVIKSNNTLLEGNLSHGSPYKTEDPTEILSRVQKAFGAILKREFARIKKQKQSKGKGTEIVALSQVFPSSGDPPMKSPTDCVCASNENMNTL